MADNTSLKTDNESLKTKVSELENKNAELLKREDLAKVGETYLKDMREKAEAHYKLLRGESVNADMLAVIQKADIAQAKAMVADFEREIEEKIPALARSAGRWPSSIAAAPRKSPRRKKTKPIATISKPGKV